MTASEQAKAAGLKNLKQVIELTDQHRDTLRRWAKNKPKLFEIVLIGCKVKAKE